MRLQSLSWQLFHVTWLWEHVTAVSPGVYKGCSDAPRNLKRSQGCSRSHQPRQDVEFEAADCWAAEYSVFSSICQMTNRWDMSRSEWLFWLQHELGHCFAIAHTQKCSVMLLISHCGRKKKSHARRRTLKIMAHEKAQEASWKLDLLDVKDPASSFLWWICSNILELGSKLSRQLVHWQTPSPQRRDDPNLNLHGIHRYRWHRLKNPKPKD